MKTANIGGKPRPVCGFAVLCVTTPPSGLDVRKVAQIHDFSHHVNRRKRESSQSFLPSSQCARFVLAAARREVAHG